MAAFSTTVARAATTKMAERHQRQQQQQQVQQLQDIGPLFFIEGDEPQLQRQRQRESVSEERRSRRKRRVDSAEKIKQSFEQLEKDLGKVRRLLRIGSSPSAQELRRRRSKQSPPRLAVSTFGEHEDDDSDEFDFPEFVDDDPTKKRKSQMMESPRVIRRRAVLNSGGAASRLETSPTKRKHTTLAVISLDTSPVPVNNSNVESDDHRFYASSSARRDRQTTNFATTTLDVPRVTAANGGPISPFASRIPSRSNDIINLKRQVSKFLYSGYCNQISVD